MRKLIRDGKVAVLYSRGFSAGWYSWHNNEELLYLPELVELVENETELTEELVTELILKYTDITKDDIPYLGGIDGLSIYWLNEYTQFFIDEYNGAESIITQDRGNWLIA